MVVDWELSSSLSGVIYSFVFIVKQLHLIWVDWVDWSIDQLVDSPRSLYLNLRYRIVAVSPDSRSLFSGHIICSLSVRVRRIFRIIRIWNFKNLEISHFQPDNHPPVLCCNTPPSKEIFLVMHVVAVAKQCCFWHSRVTLLLLLFITTAEANIIRTVSTKTLTI